MESVLKKRKSLKFNSKLDNLFKKENNRKTTILNKFVFQVVFCIVILGCLWLYKIADPLSFEYNKNKYGWLLEYNMTYDSTYNFIATALNDNFQFNIPLREIIINEKQETVQNQDIENNISIIAENNMEQNNTNDIQDAESIIVLPTIEMQSYNNMKIMAEEIKNKYKLVKPTTGQISCPFGNRQSDNHDISTFHLGIDVANVLDTKIKAAMEGKVTDVSKNSIYGNFIKVQKEDILMVYAHCNKILVKEGQDVKPGDVIAQMGKTGLATGVHLHFEVRKSGVVINPEYLIDFK